MSRPVSCALAVLALVVASAPAHAQGNLRPVQLLGGLQRVQDSIARGDQSALPLQSEMVSLLDESFRRELAASGPLEEGVRPLLMFALGGGGAMPASRMLERVPADHPDYAIAQAVLAYIVGNAAKARKFFAQVDVPAVGVPLSPYVALAKGTVYIGEDDEEARRSFDHARLLAPGTLVEEVALRRLLSIHIAREDVRGFSLVSVQYARRYIDSPFAAQFVSHYIPGVIAFDGALPHSRIRDLLSTLARDQRIGVLMRLARGAAVAGHLELSAFASGELSHDMAGNTAVSVSRVRLYENLAAVTSSNARQAYANLSGISEADLPLEDVPLLRAALHLAGAILGPATLASAAVETQPESVTANDASGSGPKITQARAARAIRDEATEPEVTDTSYEALLSSARDQLKSIDKLIDE